MILWFCLFPSVVPFGVFVVRIPPPDFEVPYRATSFPPNTVPYSGNLTFSADDLAHALFTTGRAPGDQWAHGTASVYEWLHRASLVPAYVRRTYRAELVRSSLALALDRSESVGLSYALGQATTAIFCRTQLSVAHLLHIDRYASHHGVSFGQTRRRSDLFGLAPDGWVVAEAKGRSGNVTDELRRTLEEQKRSVTAIAGERPWVALGCVASFPQRAGAMRADAFDPEKDAEEAISLDVVTRDRYMLAYYLPFLRAIELGDPDGDEESFVSSTFDSFGLRVRLPRLLVERIRSAESGDLVGLHDDIQTVLDEVHSRELQVFPDGTAVQTDWQDALALQDWGPTE